MGLMCAMSTPTHSEQLCPMSDVYDGLRLRIFDDGVMGDRTFDDGVDVGDRSLTNCLKEAIAFLIMGLM